MTSPSSAAVDPSSMSLMTTPSLMPCSRHFLDHRGRQHAFRPHEMVQADHLGERFRAQPVGERAGRALFEAGGGEKISQIEAYLCAFPHVRPRAGR
jgi:hypothetical protein